MYGANDHALNFETDDTVYFFSMPSDVLNNFSAHSVQVWARTFPTAEHAYQWKKFETCDLSQAEAVIGAESAWRAKQTGQGGMLRDNWNDIKLDIMREVITAKVSQHIDVREMLISTGDKTIVENSPDDTFWGGGPDGTGQNWVGKILMEIRESL